MGNDDTSRAVDAGARECPTPLRYTDPQSTEWSVYDELFGPPCCPSGEARVVAAGSHPRTVTPLFTPAPP